MSDERERSRRLTEQAAQTPSGLPLLVPEADALLGEMEGARVAGRALPPGPKPLIVRA